MKLTRSTGYAVGVLLRVAAQPRGASTTAAEISRGCKFPPRFLYRILRKLVDANLLLGVSGPNGGYWLARPARRVRLYDVVLAVEGPGDDAALEAVHPQHRGAARLINQVVQRQTRLFHQSLKRVTLADLMAATQKRGKALKRPFPPRRSR